jgi:hypothetical protein
MDILQVGVEVVIAFYVGERNEFAPVCKSWIGTKNVHHYWDAA